MTIIPAPLVYLILTGLFATAWVAPVVAGHILGALSGAAVVVLLINGVDPFSTFWASRNDDDDEPPQGPPPGYAT